MNEAARYRLLVAATAFLFSTGGAAIKTTTLTSWQVASFRSGTAAVALLFLWPAARRGWSWNLIPGAIAFAATLVFFAVSAKLTTSVNATFLQAAAPVYLLLIGPLLLHERPTRNDLLVTPLVAAGMLCLFLGSDEGTATAPDPVRGNVFGAVSGISYAFLLAALRRAGSKAGNSLGIVAMGNLLAFAVALPLALPVERITAADIGALFYLGCFQIALAYGCLSLALTRLAAFEASLIMLIEPVFNPLWTWLLHGEVPGPWPLTGGALILAATAGKLVLSRTGAAS
ncbi:MAG: EamA/RhaT family transporter [Acidobacteria bacterium]|nr:EamA/RhaT family transporter [Acidobacteriota bacterium]